MENRLVRLLAAAVLIAAVASFLRSRRRAAPANDSNGTTFVPGTGPDPRVGPDPKSAADPHTGPDEKPH